MDSRLYKEGGNYFKKASDYDAGSTAMGSPDMKDFASKLKKGDKDGIQRRTPTTAKSNRIGESDSE